MLEPNDLPLVCIPLELPPPAATDLIEFLHQLTAALERHYAGTLLCHQTNLAAARRARGVDDEPF